MNGEGGVKGSRVSLDPYPTRVSNLAFDVVLLRLPCYGSTAVKLMKRSRSPPKKKLEGKKKSNEKMRWDRSQTVEDKLLRDRNRATK